MSAYVLDPTWPGDVGALVDEPDHRVVTRSEVLHDGMVWDLHRDTIDLGDGQTIVREYVAHPGAVAVLPIMVFPLKPSRSERCCPPAPYSTPRAGF